jgi:hypothetical protein
MTRHIKRDANQVTHGLAEQAIRNQMDHIWVLFGNGVGCGYCLGFDLTL